ncbi:hypothetical protein SAMN04487970_1004124 [Paenibacillus tianmuensis]|uniref:Uncharacterized protein n=1 Tax=Paenibacillus tianmuensis TaxID=624147 RepID=A0A1G4PWM2_9BACL|nr:hypothetical protein SAMN04487970_1004124 [Paenibacillus tianmuensis]
MTEWMVEIQVCRLNLDANIVEEKCTLSITLVYMATNTKSQISSKPKKTVREIYPDGFS